MSLKFWVLLLVIQLWYASNVEACTDCTTYGSCIEKAADGSCTTCQCPKDFSGTCCETSPDACTLSPCSASATEFWTCSDLGGGLKDCKCQSNYTGTKCDKVKVPCDDFDCYNGGTCSSNATGTFCKCKTDYSGTNCEKQKYATCSGSYCNNGGTCYAKAYNSFACDCPAGYTGSKCETKICGSLTCQHGGKCVADSTGKETCQCLDIWKGTNCETFDGCKYLKCENGGTCYQNSTDNLPKCACLTGWDGTYCTNNPDDCLPTSATENICTSVDKSATCTDGLNNYTCVCSKEYTGDKCDTFNACFNVTCKNNGTCTTVAAKPVCSCAKGYEGPDCDIITDNCSPNPCKYTEFGVQKEANCTSSIGDFTCKCPTGTSGKDCSTNTDECKTNGTSNICTSIDAAATCSDGLNAFNCSCSLGYSGVQCKTYDACIVNICQNDGVCSTVGFNFSCKCETGWTGRYCETMIDYCSPNPCIYAQYGVNKTANCTPLLADYTCACPTGTSGKHCQVNPDDCVGHDCNLIDAAATCLDGLDTFKCKCGPTYVGTKCDTYNACFNVTCQNKGVCSTVDMQPVCACAPGYTGTLCEILIDNCSPNPCIYVEHEVTKKANCTNKVADFTCACPAGTSGKDCSVNPDDCATTATGNICTSQDGAATCSDGLNSFTCTCSVDYKGKKCETYDACVLNSCENGGNCSTVGNDFKCTCVKGYEGKRCETMTNNCLPNPCKYIEFGETQEAKCKNKLGDFDCTCPSGTSGKTCGTNPDDCVVGGQNQCKIIDLKATCSDGLNEYRCTCSPEYTGPQCKMTIIVWKVIQLFGGVDDITELLEEVVKNPSLIKDMVPFILGQQSRANQTAMSWDFDEIFEWASYEKNELTLDKDFTQTFDTTLGACYTFNHHECPRKWKSRKSGQDGGFQALMRVRQDQYLAWIDTASLLVFVHPPEESIFSESVRYQAAPNTSTTIIANRNAYSRLSGKYGTCIKDKEEVGSYYYTGDYTTAGCFRGCYQDAVYEECGCMDPRYAFPEDMPACNMSLWNCVKGITDNRGDSSNWPDCKCPSPCSESQFDSAYTKASFPASYFKCDSLENDTVAYKYCMGNYTDKVLISVYIPRLTRKVFVEVPAMSFNNFISNVGGLAGVFIGFSVVTIFDFSFIFIWIGWVLCGGKKKEE